MAGRINDVDETLAPFLNVLAQNPDLGFTPPAACESRWTNWADSISYAAAEEQTIAIEGPIVGNAACAAALPPPFRGASREGERLILGEGRLLSGSSPRRPLELAAAATQGAQVEGWLDAQALMPPGLKEQAGAMASVVELNAATATRLANEIIALGLAIHTNEERALRLHLILPEGVERASTIQLLEEARDGVLSAAENLPADSPLAGPMARASAMGASIRFRADAGGIVMDIDASLAELAELAAVSIPAFNQYTRQAKTSEAHAMLTVMSMTVAAYYGEFQSLPTRAGPLPAVPSRDAQVVDFTTDPVFVQLGFTPADPLYYSYSIVPTEDANVVILRAEGDLDGDGERSRFEHVLTCEPNNGCVPSEREESPFE